MEYISLIEKIKSKYIVNDLFSYIKDSDYLLKLAKYCKRLQNSFNLGIEDYKAKCFEKNCKQFEKFLYAKRSSKFKKDYLENIFRRDYDENIRNTILNEFSEIYFTNKYKFYQSDEQIKKNIIDNQLLIDIQSPFYKNLSKNPIFQNLFIIRIPLPFIKENYLMNDYIKEFEILNKSNTNYSALCFQFVLNNTNFLQKFLKKMKKYMLFLMNYFLNLKKIIYLLLINILIFLKILNQLLLLILEKMKEYNN